MPHAPRSLIRNLGLVLVTILLFSLSAAAGAQATAYRYWNFWTQDGDTWSYSPVGPASDEDSNVKRRHHSPEQINRCNEPANTWTWCDWLCLERACNTKASFSLCLCPMVRGKH